MLCHRYFESKQRWADVFVPMCPPGRILLLRRLKEDAAAFKRREKRAAKASGRHQGRQKRPAAPRLLWCPSCSGTLLMWDAVWVRPEQIASEGILLSRCGGTGCGRQL